MTAVLYSSYFPNVRYLSKFIRYDNVVIDIYENYTKQTYRNRCKILSANGISDLTVPVKKNFHCLMKDIEIDYSENWQKNHYRAILSAYKNSAFYDYFIDDFKAFFEVREKYLIDLNSKILDKLLKVTGIEPNYSYSLEFVKNHEYDDYRDSIHPKEQKNIVDNCFNPVEYIQVFSERHGFCKDLSVLDLIFNEGPLAKENIKRSC